MSMDIVAKRSALVGEHAMELLVDRECPLCRREADLLQRMDKRGQLKLVDISADDQVALERGLTPEQVMGHIHGVLRDGSVVTGVEAFIHAYEAAGLPWLAKLLAAPGARPIAELGYAWFAKRRLWLTGRGSEAASCDSGRCAVPATGAGSRGARPAE